MSAEKELKATCNRYHSCGCNSRETFVIESTRWRSLRVKPDPRLYYYRHHYSLPLLAQINIIRNPVYPKVPTFTDGCERGDRLKSFISIQSEPVMSSNRIRTTFAILDAEMVANQSGSAYNLRGFNFHSRQTHVLET